VSSSGECGTATETVDHVVAEPAVAWNTAGRSVENAARMAITRFIRRPISASYVRLMGVVNVKHRAR
jgi:hypothetical protein